MVKIVLEGISFVLLSCCGEANSQYVGIYEAQNLYNQCWSISLVWFTRQPSAHRSGLLDIFSQHDNKFGKSKIRGYSSVALFFKTDLFGWLKNRKNN